MERPRRLFLSYTSDLAVHADTVRLAVTRFGWEARLLEVHAASPRVPLTMSRELIADCDALVVLLAFRYGWVPSIEEGGDGERSFTWLEVLEAERRDIPVLAFVMNEDTPVPAHTVERDPARLMQLEQFKEYLKRRRFVGSFSTPDDAAKQVVLALARLDDEPRSVSRADSAASGFVASASAAVEETVSTSDDDLLSLAWHLVVDAPASRDLLLHLDGTRWRAAVVPLADKLLPKSANWNSGLPLLLNHLRSQRPGLAPNPLWMEWMRHVHSAKLAGLRSMPTRNRDQAPASSATPASGRTPQHIRGSGASPRRPTPSRRK